MIKKRKTPEENTEERPIERFAQSVIRNEMVFEILTKKARDITTKSDLQKLKDSQILTSEEWHILAQHFNSLNIDFIRNLKSDYPELTNGELRYLTMVKLGLSKAEMATLMGISRDSLRVTWHRIRKKANIIEPISPEDFIRSMEQ